MILLDREIDVVTSMCTQLTYEGLIDETLQIKNGSVTTDGASGTLHGRRTSLQPVQPVQADLSHKLSAPEAACYILRPCGAVMGPS